MQDEGVLYFPDLVPSPIFCLDFSRPHDLYTTNLAVYSTKALSYDQGSESALPCNHI